MKSFSKIISLSKVAHINGLYAIEDTIKDDDCSFLVKAVELLLDGTEPHTLRNILSNYIITSELSPVELLERMIYLEGILLIQQGVYPWDIRKRISAYFGENFIIKLNEHCTSRKHLSATLQKYKEKKNQSQ